MKMSEWFDPNIYERAIKELDPEGQIVYIDQQEEIIKYHHDDIEIDRGIRYDYHEFCRAYIVAWLCTKGGYLPSNLHIEKRYTIGRPGGTSAWGDILVYKSENSTRIPFMLIEVKNPLDYNEEDEDSIKGQLFDIAPHESGIAVLSLATVTKDKNTCSIKCITIDYCRYPIFSTWKDSGKVKTTELPKHFGKPVPEPLIRGGKQDLRVPSSMKELDHIWANLHNLLWGGYLEDNTVFEWVVRLILTKIYDEKATSNDQEYDFQIKYKEGELEDDSSTFKRINRRYKEAVHRYLQPGKKLDDIRGINSEEFSLSRVRNTVKLLQEISITNTRQAGDILARFFNKVVREGFKQSKALYLTHPNLVYFILYAIDLPSLLLQKLQSDAPLDNRIPYIIDPACGSGTFLLVALRIMEKYVRGNKEKIAITDDIKEAIEGLFGSGSTWARIHLYGMDPHQSLPIAAKVNMILHGDASGHIFQRTALLPFEGYADIDRLRRLDPLPDSRKSDPSYQHPATESFDVVVSNPPFSIELSKEEKDALGEVFKYAGKEKSENLFFERWYQLLKPGGRLGVVLPDSFFSTEDDFYIRKFCYKYFNIKAIVFLSEEAFEPYTTTLTGLLFAQKKNLDEVEEWNRIWKEEKEALTSKVKELKDKIIKKNWPLENKPQWIINIFQECREFLEMWEVTKLEGEDIEEAMKQLRYRLNKAKKEELDRFVIRRVCKRLNYEFPIITLENIGYKRTKRSIRERDNELLHMIDLDGNEIKNIEDADMDLRIVNEKKDPKTALDVIRKVVKWD